MKGFVIRGKLGCYLQITLDELFGFPKTTSHFGGYDVKGTVEIKSGSYFVMGELWFSTGEIYLFYNQLVQCYKDLEGVAKFCSSETNLEFEIKFRNRGQVFIQGAYKEFESLDNELKFEIESNQSFYLETLEGLREIVNLYGDLKGVNDSNSSFG
ncbi:hypothetical protein [Paenibacillus paridis]|uniref:WapI family immunity protein n=1 Tax=Paenibacillus paridis TaxID=2583376 RepID=UPI001123007D|nr:hypothetical protein [Paenibacillus paridis]